MDIQETPHETNGHDEPFIAFAESLPEGNPTLSFTQNSNREIFLKGMNNIMAATPSEFLKLLNLFSRTDRAELISKIDWRNKFPDAVYNNAGGSSILAHSAHEALGVKNARSLALYLTQGRSSLSRAFTGITLVNKLPLDDVSAVFSQYPNFARSDTEFLTRRDFIWRKLFSAGLDTLYACSLENDRLKDLLPEKAGPLISQMVDELAIVGHRIKEPFEEPDHLLRESIEREEGSHPGALGFGYYFMMAKIRPHMSDPSRMDTLAGYFGAQFDFKENTYIYRKK